MLGSEFQHTSTVDVYRKCLYIIYIILVYITEIFIA